MPFQFKVLKEGKNTQARLGEMTTTHGVIETPVFMPVGTVGTVKAMRTDELKQMGAQIILGNTYHLYLRPGHKLIQKLGGLHQFMNWSAPLLTDSGGFQVFSLGREPDSRQGAQDEDGLEALRKTKLAKITDEGVEFQSHVDGAKHFMTPELSIEIQQALGSDIMMVFDECLEAGADHERTKKSLERSLDWEKRSLVARADGDQALFGIVQGGFFKDLRQECLSRLMDMKRGERAFEGYALGGLSVGEPIPQMYEMAQMMAPLMPVNKPRYLMGVGMPVDLVNCIDFGLDMFDCVIPTRNARNGMLFTSTGFIYIKQAQFAEDKSPIDPDCRCYTCQNYSRAYLRHLHLAKEILSSILSTLHNLHYYLNLIVEIRAALREDRFAQFKNDFLGRNLP